jgi:hypothetical protein
MAASGKHQSTERRGREDTSRLAWAFVLSLLLHVVVFGVYRTGNEFDWWNKFPWPQWLRSPKMLTELVKQSQQQQLSVPREIPLQFIDVSPAQTAPEPPKDPKYYSNKDSVAANPEPQVDTEVPKIDGKQIQVAKTEDVPRVTPAPLQPTPPPSREPQPPEEEQKPKLAEPPGDLALAKAEPAPRKDEGQAEQPRPRRISEALARQMTRQTLTGQKMKQEGGVKRRLEISSVDAKATPVGDYDYALIEAVQQCWYGLLDAQRYASDYRGKVVLQFRLHHDGSVTELRVVENSAGPIPGLICETAVDKPKPFEKFPVPMRRMVGDTREIQFTFYYN